MEPETPSRRKKAGDEPVTIDLEAVPASAENEARTAEEKAEADAATADTNETVATEAVASEPEIPESRETSEE
ncbi:MAG: hypothetical protein ACO1PQ_05385, partial [Rhizobium sp.]